MDNQPFPLPRQIRETDIMAGDGSATYGPFGFKIFDETDIIALIRRDGENVFTAASITVTKVSGLPFDDFKVTFASALAPQDSYVIRSSRLHERQIAITRGGAISGKELEKELSKQGTVLQELQRDARHTIRVQPGEVPPSIELLPDNHIWMSQDGNMVDGGSVKAIDDARDQARDSAAAALNSEQAAGRHAGDTAADRGAVADDRAAAAVSAEAAANSAGDASASADAAADDKAIVSGWRTQIEGWKNDVASDRNDVQDDKVTTALLADAAALSAAEAHEALDMLYQYGDFNNRYIGEHAANPTSWNSGSPLDPGTDALITGLIYYNTDIEEYRTYSGTDWASGAGNTSDFARKSLNGSDYNAATFRANLDLYSTSQTLNLPAGRATASAIDDDNFVQVVVAGAWRKMAWATVKGWIKGWITKADVGLGNVANVAPADLPVSTAQATAIDAKVNRDGDTVTNLKTTTAPADNNHVATKQYVDDKQSGLGIGQEWINVLANRTANTTYQNTTGRTIAVSVGNDIDNSQNAGLEVSANGTTGWLRIGAGSWTTDMIIVPPDWYYRWTRGTPARWAELR